jgi:hypothetical protein
MQFWFARKVTVCPRGRNGAKRRVLLENVSRSLDPAEHPRTRRIRKKMRTAAAKLQVLGVRSETASFRTAAAKHQVLGVRMKRLKRGSGIAPRRGPNYSADAQQPHAIGYARRYVSWHVLTNSSTSIFSSHKNNGITSLRIFVKKPANLRFVASLSTLIIISFNCKSMSRQRKNRAMIELDDSSGSFVMSSRVLNTLIELLIVYSSQMRCRVSSQHLRRQASLCGSVMRGINCFKSNVGCALSLRLFWLVVLCPALACDVF